MKIYFTLFAVVALFASCYNPFHKTVTGNGNIKTDERNPGSFKTIRCDGSYDVELTQGNASSVKIETDDNLLPYIETRIDGDELVIRTQDDVNVRSSDKIKVYITANKIEGFKLAGSGNVKTTNKFTNGDHLDLSIAGSGDIHFDVNTPSVRSSISGSGNIYLTGETKDSRIDIAGTGNYHADELKAENATIKIAGNGEAWLFADNQLDINIAGIGNVYYKGNATVNQKIAGSGKIEKKE